MTKPLTRAEWLEYLDTTWKKSLHEAWDKEWEDMKNDAMTFDQWWATITPKEQLALGRNNAKFVWDSALDECVKVCLRVEAEHDWFPSCSDAIHNMKGKT